MGSSMKRVCGVITLHLTIVLLANICKVDAFTVKVKDEKFNKNYHDDFMMKDVHVENESDGKLKNYLGKRLHAETRRTSFRDAVLLKTILSDTQAFETSSNYKANKNENSLAIGVKMNSTGVALEVNGKIVYTCLNKTMKWGRKFANLCSGIHLITLNEVTGQVMRAESYMTWQLTSENQLLIGLNEIQEGRLLVFLGLPDFTTQLSSETLDILFKHGSNYADATATNEIWCFVAYKGGPAVLETIIVDSTTSNETMEVSPLLLHFNVARKHERRCEWYGQSDMAERKEFCEAYEGYGNFCSCDDFPWTPSPNTNIEFPINEEIPVAVITAHRLPHVLRQISQIWSNAGGSRTPIVIMVDGQNTEARQLGSLLNITVVEDNNPTPSGSAKRVNYHIKFAMLEVFNTYPHVDKAIILEDDLNLAPDFISYFHQTAPLLTTDKKLLCVNAFNYNAFNHTVFDPSRLYRSHGVPAYGWMVTKSTAHAMAENWSLENQSVDWDLWIRLKMNSDVDVIIPEVPRTKHRGGGGVHVSGLEQYIYYDQRPLNNVSNVTMDIKSVERETYLKTHYRNIKRAKILRFKDHPCKDKTIPRYKVNGTYVIYVYQPDESNSSNAFYVVNRCFGLYDRGLHENLKMMITAPFFENQLYVIGCPNSSFCMTENPADIYHATPEDVNYAYSHPFRRTDITSYYARRAPPASFEDLMYLDNLQGSTYYHSQKQE